MCVTEEYLRCLVEMDRWVEFFNTVQRSLGLKIIRSPLNWGIECPGPFCLERQTGKDVAALIKTISKIIGGQSGSHYLVDVNWAPK